MKLDWFSIKEAVADEEANEELNANSVYEDVPNKEAVTPEVTFKDPENTESPFEIIPFLTTKELFDIFYFLKFHYPFKYICFPKIGIVYYTINIF